MSDDPAQQHFLSLPPARQCEVVRRLQARGYDAETIAHMSGLHVETVARFLAQESEVQR